MNYYNNKFGFHTPEKSLEYFKTLKKNCSKLSFQDSSWHNDTSDSVTIKQLSYVENNFDTNYVVYFPNSDIQDLSNELTNTFYLFDSLNGQPKEFKNITQLINFLNNIKF